MKRDVNIAILELFPVKMYALPFSIVKPFPLSTAKNTCFHMLVATLKLTYAPTCTWVISTDCTMHEFAIATDKMGYPYFITKTYVVGTH